MELNNKDLKTIGYNLILYRIDCEERLRNGIWMTDKEKLEAVNNLQELQRVISKVVEMEVKSREVFSE